jgi:hypothetical protein
MRKLVVAVAVIALGLTGCAASPSGYIDAIRGDHPALLDAYTEDELVSLGNDVCDALEGGMSGHRAAGALEISGIPLADAGTIVLTASDHLCPQYADTVN